MSVPPGPVPAEGPTTRSRRCSPIGRLRGRCGTGRSRYAAEVTERRGEERGGGVAGSGNRSVPVPLDQHREVLRVGCGVGVLDHAVLDPPAGVLTDRVG
jgi:hypothetical protein